MYRILISSAVFVAVAFLPASATIINIPDDYPTIQQGIDACNHGDTVLVQPGTYVEYIHLGPINIVIGSMFLTSGDTSYISSTIIDGDLSDRVVISGGQDSTAIISGFTLQNGSAYRGGGIRCSYSNPIIMNNTIIGNSAEQAGGGIFCYSSDPIIMNNTIIENSAEEMGGGIACAFGSNPRISVNTISQNSSFSGGGIYCGYSSDPTIIGNIISDNIVVSTGSGGGGIFCGAGTQPFIIGNTISGNSAGSGGGGIVCINSNPIIRDNTICENSTVCGGGIRCDQLSSPMIHNNIISYNSATGIGSGGGGIFCSGFSEPTIRDNIIEENFSRLGGGISCSSSPPINGNIISGNSVGYYGGGIFFSGSISEVGNNIIKGNSAGYYGGGIYCQYANPTIINNIVYGNHSASGGGIYCTDNSTPLVKNTIFWADTATTDDEIYLSYNSSIIISFSCIQDTVWPGEGNKSEDPLFRDPENDIFHLMYTACGDPEDSPCIDAGDPTIFDAFLNCDWGLGELRSDMGAYGGEGIPTDVDEEQIPEIPMQFLLSQNHPNPFNATTTIGYELPTEGPVTMEIYDILGRKIETLVDNNQSAGYKSVTWNASSCSSGIYFYKLTIGEKTITKRMTYLK